MMLNKKIKKINKKNEEKKNAGLSLSFQRKRVIVDSILKDWLRLLVILMTHLCRAHEACEKEGKNQ